MKVMRKWVESISPKQANDLTGCYAHTTWLKEMDRCWDSDDGFQVTSRMIFTDWGKVEHAAITHRPNHTDVVVDSLPHITTDGSGDIPWNVKQEIKNEIWGKDRLAIEVFPKEKDLVDVTDCYHIWVLPKGFKLPFGIHPTHDTQCKPVNRGVPKLDNSLYLANNVRNLLGE